MDDVDVEQHFGTCRTGEGARYGEELLILHTTLVVNDVHRREKCRLTVCSSIHLRSSTNFLWNLVSLAYHSAIWSLNTYDLKMHWWSTKSSEAQMPIRQENIMSLMLPLSELETQAMLCIQWTQERRQRHLFASLDS